jgi:IS5 family transposase
MIVGAAAPDGTPTKGPRYKHEFGTPKPDAQESFTDTDSRTMKRAGGGFDYSYNAFAAVDDQAHIIVAAELTNNAADSGQLAPLVEVVRASTGELPAHVVADAGFRSEAQFEQLADTAVELIVALGREGKQQLLINSAQYPHTAQMAAKLQTDHAQVAYRRRKWLSEPPNGWVKNVLGFCQFSLRGLAKVKAEWRLVCTALNLRRMASMMPG